MRSKNIKLFASVMKGCRGVQSEIFSAEDPELIQKKTCQLVPLLHFSTSLLEFEGHVEVILSAAVPETTGVHFQIQTQFSHVRKQFLHFLQLHNKLTQMKQDIIQKRSEICDGLLVQSVLHLPLINSCMHLTVFKISQFFNDIKVVIH